MQIELHEQAITDFEFWKKSGNQAIHKKIELLITAIQENHYSGIGKPEQLKFKLSGQWYRRINEEHRIYEVIN